MRYRGPSSSAHASSSWRAVHSAVGCSVTLRCTSRRLLWVRITSTNRTRKVAVGTVKKSNAIRSLAWFFKNARHACDGGLRGRSTYFETVACDTVRPSFSSSPWIRGAPQRIGAAYPPNQVSDLRLDRGPTASASTLPRPVAPESPPVPPHQGLRPHHLQGIPPALPEPGHHDPADPIHRCQPWPRLARLPHGELVAQGQVLEGELAVAAAEEREKSKQVEQEDDHRAEILSGSAPTDQQLAAGRGFGEAQIALRPFAWSMKTSARSASSAFSAPRLEPKTVRTSAEPT